MNELIEKWNDLQVQLAEAIIQNNKDEQEKLERFLIPQVKNTLEEKKIWLCGAENESNIIAFLEKGILTFRGKGYMKRYTRWDETLSSMSEYTRLNILANDYDGKFEEKHTIFDVPPWHMESITKVIIEEGIKSICPRCFEKAYGMTSITIPASVIKIGENAFRDCTGLKTFINHNPSPQIIDGCDLFDYKTEIIKKGERKKYKKDDYKIDSGNIFLRDSVLYDEWNLLGKVENFLEYIENTTEEYEYKESVLHCICSEAILYVPASSIYVYKQAPVWSDRGYFYNSPFSDSSFYCNRFYEIRPIQEEQPSDYSPEQIDIIIAELQTLIDELLLKKAIMRGIKGNPKHVADFMDLFNQRDGLKYLTHDFDESGEFDIDEFLAKAKAVCTEKFKELEIPKSLKELINQFPLESEPKWETVDNQFKTKAMASGWSSFDLAEAKANGMHPIKNHQLADVIKDFKRAIRIESPVLETLVNKVFVDDSFEIEKKDLSKADFYTNVGDFKAALETIFEEIQKRGDSPDKKRVSVEYKKETCDDYFIRKIVITHHNSFPRRDDEDALIKEWLSFNKGNMAKIGEHLQGYCHWSVVTKIDDKPVKVNILREKGTPEQEEIDASEVQGFTHILTFYYQA
jgi:hypothetical protein